MGLTAVCFALAVAFLCAFVYAKEQIPEGGKNGICTSRECTIVAADILRDMRPSADPCHDFFDFNCGGFVDRVSIPDDKAQIGYFNLVKKENQEIIRGILSPEVNNVQKGKDDASRRNLSKLQALYGSCMDEKKMTEVGVKPLADLVQKIITLFPATFSVLDNGMASGSLKSNLQTLRGINAIRRQSTGRVVLQQQETSSGNSGTRDDDVHQEPFHTSGGPMTDDLLEDHEDIPSQVDVFLSTGESAVTGPILSRNQRRALSFSSSAKADREELALVIAQLAWVGVTAMVEFDVDADPKNPNQTVLMLGESGLGLPSKEYYEEEKIVNIYQQAVEDMFTIIMGTKDKDKDKNNDEDKSQGDDKDKEGVWAEVAKNVVGFEKLMAAISSDQEDLDNSELTYNPRTLSQITDLAPAIDWSLILEKLLGRGARTPNPIIVSMPDYLEKLNALIRETPAITLQNYFAWRLIQKLSVNLGVEYRKPLLLLKAALQGVSAEQMTPRWETCVDVVDSSLGAMAGYYFIQKAFQGDSKEMADSIISSLRSSFVHGLSKLNWLDKETLLNATEKVDLLIQKVGYSTDSPDVRSPESLEDYFKDLGVDKADFFGNQIRARTWTTQKVLGDLGKPVDKAKWLMSPQTVNAYYNPSANEIVFPAGILQQPFFHGDSPEYLNYGGIGVVAGHELTHAFDNEGRLFDAHGKLSDWWSNSTLKEFKERSQCFIDQYGNFTVKDPQGRENHVNGKLTLGENLADNGGLKRSFDAWQTRFKSDPRGSKYKNHLLAGLEDYSREQLFYMSFARVWCSQRRPASAIEGLRTDPHAPARWRVNGAVQNSPHFAEVFGCKARSPMNPDSKCDLW
ncbi:hypothetical protein EDD11_003138 [Mortierella claussenii]|nr:hypothetical protein EDD11_003138 [Mortierella claussenii]